MATTVFSANVSGNYTIQSNTSQSFTLNRSSGDSIPSGSVVQSVQFSFSAIVPYSAMRLFQIVSGATALCDPLTTTGSNVREPMAFPLFGINVYAGASVPITVKGAGRGSASADGNVMSIRDGCVISIQVNWVEKPVTTNNPPQPPKINAPVANGTTYNPNPRLLVTVGTDAENNAQSLSAAGYTGSRSGNLAPGQKVILARTATLQAAGSQSVSITATDTGGLSSAAATTTFTYAVPSYSASELTPGSSYVKGADMRELRIIASNMARYYGLPEPDFGAEIIDLSTSLGLWSQHIEGLRTAINAIVAHVNAWDTSGGNKISTPEWIPIPENRPRADVMKQLRSVLVTL